MAWKEKVGCGFIVNFNQHNRSALFSRVFTMTSPLCQLSEHTPTTSTFQLISKPLGRHNEVPWCNSVKSNRSEWGKKNAGVSSELQKSAHCQKSPAINSALAHLLGVTQPSITVTLPAANRFHLLTVFRVWLGSVWARLCQCPPNCCSLLCAACQKNLQALSQMGKVPH